jgi:hypothetical protein
VDLADESDRGEAVPECGSLEAEQDAFESLFSLERLRRTWQTLRRELRQLDTRED